MLNEEGQKIINIINKWVNLNSSSRSDWLAGCYVVSFTAYWSKKSHNVDFPRFATYMTIFAHADKKQF
jgi:hypothetical protein